MTTVHLSYPPTCAASSLAARLPRMADGEPAAWQEIVHGYGEVVAATVRSFHLQDADARDAVQMTWLQLAAHARQIRHPERLSGWLVTTARRACLRILRHTTPNLDHVRVPADTVVDPFPGPGQHPVDGDVTRTLRNLVSARLTRIPVGGIGPTRARALAWPKGRFEQDGLGSDVW